MTLMRNLFVFLLFASSIAFVGCGDDKNVDCNTTCEDNQILDIDCECIDVEDSNVNLVSDDISSDTEWTSDKIWVLTTRIAVKSGATLTIQPGTIVKGQAGSGPNATALLVARGGKLNANGTATQPIIFTSVADEIQPGSIESPNLDVETSGLWGGLIILGNAPISAVGGDAVQIEGIPPSVTEGLYGGTVNDDNSGTIRYVSIRHGGANIGDGNEINGLTLGGVGNGTTIENIEILSNQDDGVEPFGGSVDLKNILVWNQSDDAYDCDQAYTGTIDNFIYIAGEFSDHAMELDGPEGARMGSFTLKNGSLKGYADNPDDGEYIDLRDGVRCNISNCRFFNFKGGADVELDNNEVTQNYMDGLITFSNLQFNTSHLTEGNTTIDQIFAEKTGEGESSLNAFTTKPLDASIIATANPSVGADASVFAGWTLAAVRGELDEF